MNKNLLPLQMEEKTTKWKRMLLLLCVVLITFTVIAPHLVVSADNATSSFGDQIIDWILDALRDLFNVDPPDCTDAGCISALGAHSKGEYYECVEQFYEWGTFKRTVFDWACLCAGGDLLADDFSLDLNGSSLAAVVWRASLTAYDAMQVIGYLLVVLYFVLEVLDSTTRDNFNLEQLLRMTIKLFIAILLIANGWDILRALIDFSNGLLYQLADGMDGAAPMAVSTIYENMVGMGILEFPFYPLTLLFSSNFNNSGLVTLVYTFMIHARLIEIAGRTAFAPVAMANIYQGGLNSSGIKYLKKFLAVCMHGALIFLCVSIRNVMFLSISADVGAVSKILIDLVCVSVMIKSKSWANDIVGV